MCYQGIQTSDFRRLGYKHCSQDCPEEGEGKLILSVRRGTKLMDVELQLQVLGSYSSTTPYYCEKSENIVKNAEAWISRRYRPESAVAEAELRKRHPCSDGKRIWAARGCELPAWLAHIPAPA